jgi:type I restriction enzyme S subunit
VSELPVGWEWKSLGEVAKWGSGGTPKATRSDFYGGNIPWAVIGDLNDGLVTETEKHITREALSESSAKLVPAGAILIAMYGSIGKLGIAGVEMTTNQAIAFAIPDERLVLPKYLYWFLAGQRDSFLKSGKGMTQQNISQTILKAWEMPVPPLDVQQGIVEVLEDHLSRLDKALAEVEVARRQSESLARAMRRDVFAPASMPDGWVSTRLSDVLSPIAGKRLTQRGWSPQCLNHPRSSDEGWGVLKTTAIQLGDFQPHHHKELPASLDAKPEIEVVPGDLIMTATGPRNRCGIPCLVQETPLRLMMSGKMFRFRANPSVCDSRWLLQFLLSDVGQRQLESLKVGSSDSSVSIGSQQFENIEMPLPPLSVQLSLLSELDQQVDRAKHFGLAIESTGAQAETLRRSLLHSAFTGQLTNEDSYD